MKAGRIVVDSVMLQALIDRIPVVDAPSSLVGTSLAGWPVLIDNTIGENRGYIDHGDGRIEKFGAWPKAAEVQP